MALNNFKCKYLMPLHFKGLSKCKSAGRQGQCTTSSSDKL